MSNLLEVPAYLIMAFSMALEAPSEKASRVSAAQISRISFEQPGPGSTSRYTISDGEWLRAVKIAGSESDVLKTYADRIFVTSTGRYYVVDEEVRADISALSRNPRIVERVMTAGIAILKSCIEKKLERAPSRTALLIGHYFGCDAAARYANTLERAPETPASVALPQLKIDTAANTKLSDVDVRLARTISAAARGETPRKPADTVAAKFEKPRYGAAGLAALKGAITAGDRTEAPRVAASK